MRRLFRHSRSSGYRSRHAEFVLAASAFFFLRDHDLICFPRSIAERTYVVSAFVIYEFLNSVFRRGNPFSFTAKLNQASLPL